MFETFEEFLVQSRSQIPLATFITNLICTGFFSFLLGKVYIKYGVTLSNRRSFSKNFLLISMTTMLIISIVKSSLALSLGLVGALSIIRFRAAIKEPEELAFLFLAITIGLGFGADQGLITSVSFLIIVIIIVLIKNNFEESINSQNLHLTISSDDNSKIDLNKIIELLKTHSKLVNLNRFDETNEFTECSFLVEFDNFNEINLIKNELRKIDSKIKISFLDNKGTF